MAIDGSPGEYISSNHRGRHPILLKKVIAIRSQRLFAALVLLFVAVLVPSTRTHAQSAPPVNVALFDSYVDLVYRESMLEPSKEILVQGAAQGIRAYVAKKGFDASLAPLPSDVEALKKEYLDALAAHPELNSHEMFYVAMKAMLLPLKEQYTRFLTPVEYRHLQARVEGTDESNLGFRVEADSQANQAITVAEVFDDTPAAQNDVRAGDRLTEIEGQPTEGMALGRAKELLCGPTGSSVKLAFSRDEKVSRVVLTRTAVNAPTVIYQKLSSQVGYIRVHAFAQNVGIELDKALSALEGHGVSAYVVDLRDNRGGYVSSAVDVASRFLPAGTRIMSLAQRKRSPLNYTAYPTQRGRKPVVVLVNERTASASEIVAGALQDHQIATIMGCRSFGKALVQKVVPLPDGCAFTISTGRYLTPKGRDIHKHGITPDVALRMSSFAPVAADTDIQRAVALLESRLGALTP